MKHNQPIILNLTQGFLPVTDWMDMRCAWAENTLVVDALYSASHFADGRAHLQDKCHGHNRESGIDVINGKLVVFDLAMLFLGRLIKIPAYRGTGS